MIYTGVLMEIGRGTISSVMGRRSNRADLIPVDIVCNTIITAAWANSFMRSPDAITVYNCTSGQINPLTYKQLLDKNIEFWRRNPSKYIMMNPNCCYHTNRLIHTLYEIVLHFMPAFIFDLVLKAKGKKPIMLKIAKRSKLASDTGEYFVLNEWNFSTKNYQRLMRAARQTQADYDEFVCDVSHLDWDAYFDRYLMGIRTLILRDDMSSLPNARRKLQKIYWTQKFLQFLLMAGAIYFFLIGVRN